MSAGSIIYSKDMSWAFDRVSEAAPLPFTCYDNRKVTLIPVQRTMKSSVGQHNCATPGSSLLVLPKK